LHKEKLNILFVASEVVPFAKTGGLADVSGALPKALKALGHNVIVVMPRYYQIDPSKLTPLKGSMGVTMGPMGELWSAVYTTKIPGSDVDIYFIDHEQFYGRKGLYDEHAQPYTDNDNRYIYLSKAAFVLCKKLGFTPDVIHANDWHTATMPLLAKTRYVHDFGDAVTVLTIHNLQHQGNFFKGGIDVLEVGWEHFNPEAMESMDQINMLKGGIAYADAITTVSKRYAKEIQTPEFGFGLEEHIKAHAGKLYGILNGVDYDEWSPAIDPYLPATYDTDTMAGKLACKHALQKHFGLDKRDNTPLIGFVGRFAEQKGISLIAGAIEGLLELDLQIVMLGTGEKWAEHFFSDIAARYGGKFALHVGYSDALAHQIEAGSDLFLMPSLFEPCGLNQIYSLRYGTLPIVRATGGLDDTIENFDEETHTGNGFKFDYATNEALYYTVRWAVETYHNQGDAFRTMQYNAMKMHFGWDDAAQAYVDVYHYAIAKRRVSQHQ